MAKMVAVPRSQVGITTLVSPAVLSECEEILHSLKENEAVRVSLDADEDPAVYRKAFSTVATMAGVVVRVRKAKGSNKNLFVVKLTPEEAADFVARQQSAAKKRSATLKAKTPAPKKASPAKKK
jgi:hypothetical protein